jgi:DNA-directed RNA polymerase subunit RPC12/RpoP
MTTTCAGCGRRFRFEVTQMTRRNECPVCLSKRRKAERAAYLETLRIEGERARQQEA